MPQSYFERFIDALKPLSDNPRRGLNIQFDSYANYQCSTCGACCQRPWGVKVSSEFVDKHQKHFEAHPSGRFHAPFQLHTNGNYYIRKASETSACIFLDADNLCFIHKHYGPDNLPQVCQIFPRSIVQKELSFQMRYLMPSCTIVPNLYFEDSELRINSISISKPGKPLRLKNEQFMDQQGSLLWSGLILDILVRDALTAIDSLKMAGLMLNSIYHQRHFIDTSHLIQLQKQFNKSENKLMLPSLKEYQTQTLDWILGHLPEHLSIFSELSRTYKNRLRIRGNLTPFEQEQLNTFMKGYLKRILLVLPFWRQGHLTLYQEMVRISSSMFLLQLLAHYFKETTGKMTPENLNQALLNIEIHLLQSLDWIKGSRFDMLSTHESQIKYQSFLSLDLCR